MELTVGSRLKHAWNAFLNRAPTANYQYGIGVDMHIDQTDLGSQEEMSVLS